MSFPKFEKFIPNFEMSPKIRGLQTNGLGFALAELHGDVGTSTQKAIVVTGGHVQMELIHISSERIDIPYYIVKKCHE